jgi:hypothetical protein
MLPCIPISALPLGPGKEKPLPPPATPPPCHSSRRLLHPCIISWCFLCGNIQEKANLWYMTSLPSAEHKASQQGLHKCFLETTSHRGWAGPVLEWSFEPQLWRYILDLSWASLSSSPCSSFSVHSKKTSWYERYKTLWQTLWIYGLQSPELKV